MLSGLSVHRQRPSLLSAAFDFFNILAANVQAQIRSDSSNPRCHQEIIHRVRVDSSLQKISRNPTGWGAVCGGSDPIHLREEGGDAVSTGGGGAGGMRSMFQPGGCVGPIHFRPEVGVQISDSPECRFQIQVQSPKSKSQDSAPPRPPVEYWLDPPPVETTSGPSLGEAYVI